MTEAAFFLTACAVNIACAVWSIRAAYRHITARRQAIQAAALLRNLCAQAYMFQHQPIWQLWADCLGDIRCRVQFFHHEIDGETP